MNRVTTVVAGAGLTLLAATVASQAWQAQGALTGVVRDSQGGVVPGVTVAATGLIGGTRTAVTNASGSFSMGTVPAGQYDVTASIQGFRTWRGRVNVLDGRSDAFAIRLEIGSLAEMVTVRGAAPAGTASAEVAGYFDLAKAYAQRGRMAEAEEATAQALRLVRAQIPTVAPTAPAPAPSGPIRVGGDIVEPRKVRHITPEYPAAAQAAGLSGAVVIEAVVAVDGTVRNAVVLKSVAGLDDAALAAVRQWLYTPTRLNGVPVEVVMTASVVFSGR
jgi:TonB family protein